MKMAGTIFLAVALIATIDAVHDGSPIRMWAAAGLWATLVIGALCRGSGRRE